MSRPLLIVAVQPLKYMCLYKNKIEVHLIHLTFTPDTVFSTKIFCRHYYFENVLFSILG